MALNIQGSGQLIYRHLSKDVTTKRTLQATRILNTFHKTNQQLILWDGLTLKNVNTKLYQVVASLPQQLTKYQVHQIEWTVDLAVAALFVKIR